MQFFHARLMVFFSIFLFISHSAAQTINIDSNWLQSRTPPYKLDTANATYRLMTDVTTNGSAFDVTAGGITFDLNGKTITYANQSFTGVPNSGFELGQNGNAEVPTDWDLTNAPNAKRQDSSQKLFFGDYSLSMTNPAGGAAEVYVLSAPVNLPVAGRYAVISQVAGGPWNKVKVTVGIDGLAVACNNSSSQLGSEYVGTDMSMGIICEFSVTTPTTVRAKVTLGTVDQSASTSVSIDEVDIRPVGMFGVGRSGYPPSLKEVRNGSIIEGQSKAIYSHALYRTEASLIHDLRIITNGVNSSNIYEMWTSGTKIYNNHLESLSTFPLHRHFWFSMIDLSRTDGGNEIYNNTLLYGPHVGIAHGSYDGTNQPSSIHHNTIQTKVTATNGFSISAAENLDIYENIIKPFQGHGIGAMSGAFNIKIRNNIIEPKSWPCSEYSTYSYPNSAHGIRLKTYGSGNMRDIEVFGNTITGSTNQQKSNCYTEVVGITNYITDDSPGTAPNPSNISIHDNTVSVSTDNYLLQHAIAFKMAPYGSIYKNHFKSNHIIVELSDNDAALAQNSRMVSNTFEKGPNPSGFHTFRSAYYRPTGSVFLDTTLIGGADLKDVYAWNVNYSQPANYTVSWYLTVRVRNLSNQNISNARIVVRDKSNTIVSDTVSDSQGMAILELKEYTHSYSNSSTISSVTPYSVQVSKSGVNAAEQSVGLTFSSGITVTLNVPGDVNSVPPSAPGGLRVIQ